MASKIEEIKALNTVLQEIDTTIKQIGMSAAKMLEGNEVKATIKDLKDVSAAISELKKSNDALNTNQKEQAKIKKQLNDLTDEEVKGKIRFQKANAQQKKDLEAELILEQKSIKNRKELRETLKALRIEADKLDLGSDELKAANAEINKLTDALSENSDQFVKNKINIGNYKSATDGLTLSFEDQKKKLKILEDTYKDAVSQGNKNTKEVKELKKALDDQKEAVEEVAKSTKEAEKATKGFGNTAKAIGIGGLIALLAKLGEMFGTSREASIEAEKKLAIMTETLKVFFAALVNSWTGFKEILIALKEGIQSTFLSLEIGYNKLLLGLAKVDGSTSFTPKAIASANEAIKNYTTEINNLTKEQLALDESNNTVFGGVDKITKAWEGFGSKVKGSIDLGQKFIDLQFKTKIEIEAQTRALGGLQEQRQILQDISDDDTLGFITRAQAVKDAQVAAIEFADKEVALAKLKEKLTIEAIKLELFRTGVVNDATLEGIKRGEDLNDLLKDRAIAMKISDENETAFTDAFVERKDKEVEALSFARDQEEKNRKTARDAFEQENDILVEFSELQFARNEALVNSDKKSQAERQRIFLDNQKISEETYLKSISLMLEQSMLSIDLNKKLTDVQKIEKKNALLQIDFNKILLEQDASKRAELIRALDLGEIEEKVLKDTFKIKFSQNESLIEQQKTLNESQLNALNISEEIALQEIALQDTTIKKLEDLDESRFELEKENLKERIDLLEEDSIERLNLEKQLNDLLLDAKKEQLEKEAELEEEARQRRIDNANLIADATLENLKADAEAKSKALDEEVNNAESALTRQQQLGVRNTKFEEQQLKEAQLKKQQQLERQAEIEKAIQLKDAFFGFLQARIEQNPDGAAQRALGDVAVAEALSRAIGFVAGFEKGGLVEGNEQLIRINEKGKEFVIDAPTTAQLGLNKKGTDMSDFKSKILSGQMFQPKIDNAPRFDDRLYYEVKRLNNNIENKPTQTIDVNKAGNILERIETAKYRETIVHKRNLRQWR